MNASRLAPACEAQAAKRWPAQGRQLGRRSRRKKRPHSARHHNRARQPGSWPMPKPLALATLAWAPAA
eukprot:13413090-Alexandrium_andersonii.AAC.1